MNKIGKILIIFSFLLVVGCSSILGAIEPAKTQNFIESPSTADLIKPVTDPPTVTSTDPPSPSITPTQLPYTMIEIKNKTGGLASVLFREAQRAEELGQAPYIQIFADWCPSCRALIKGMKDERMIEAYRGTYIILANIDIWQYQFPKVGIYVNGVPAIYELTNEGKPTGRFITGAAWDENTIENMAPPLDQFFHPEK
jgi:hypothetical protein